MHPKRTILVTGGSGYLGRQVVARLANSADAQTVVSVDLRRPLEPSLGVVYATADVCSPRLTEIIGERNVEVVIHLAAVVTPRPGQTREDQHRIDVQGTRNLVEACAAHGVRKLVYTSSGAAYGYSALNGPLLDEGDTLRGNEVFAYAWHKRLVEEMLADWRQSHPELQQLIFRVSTILGPTVNNQITALFERRIVLGLRGVDTPFCFVSDEDVVSCLVAGACDDNDGIFNLTGDGVMTLREIAVAMGRRFVGVPERWLKRGLAVGHHRGWVASGPEQTLFLRHRPVMSNERLKRVFGRPASSREVFERYRGSRV